MFRAILVIVVLISSSCSLLRGKQDYSEVMYSYLVPTEGRDEQLSSQDIKKVITQQGSMAGGNYQLKLTPVPQRLVKAYYKEMSFRNGLNEREKENLWNKLNTEYLNNKTCVHFEYQVTKHKKVKDLESWKLTIKDHDGQTYPISWKDKPLFSMPALTKIRRSGNMLEQWLFEGTGCADTTVPLDKEFAVNVKPAYVQWPFPSSKDFWWEFDRVVKKEDGEEEVVKKKKRSFQKYRGY
jgi:hypothetical protein